MKHLLSLLLIVSTISAFAQTGQKNFIDQNYIEVTGKAEMKVTPDLIYIKIILSEKDSKKPIAETERSMVNKFLELSIEVKKDLVVNDLLSRYKQKTFSKAEVVLTKEFQLVVHDAKTAAKIFSELEKLDISNVSIQRLDHTKIEEYRKEVKTNAIKAAKEKAEYLTKAINQSIGKAIYVDELGGGFVFDGQPNMMRSNNYSWEPSNSDGGGDYALDFEKIKLESSILVRFELK